MIERYVLLGFAIGFWIMMGVVWVTGILNDRFDIALALITSLVLIGLYVGTEKD